MSEEQIERRASIAILTWLAIQVENEGSNTEWLVAPIYDSTFYVVAGTLDKAGILDQTHPNGMLFKRVITAGEVEKSSDQLVLDIHSTLHGFLVLGGFNGYLTIYYKEGFKIEPALAVLFDDLISLGYCSSENDYYFWTKKILQIKELDTHKLYGNMYSYYLSDFMLLEENGPIMYGGRPYPVDNWKSHPRIWRYDYKGVPHPD